MAAAKPAVEIDAVETPTETPKRITINIASQGEDRSTVYLCFGSDAITISRDVDVEVPAWVEHVLNDALDPIPVKDAKGGVTGDTMIYKKRFPFSIVSRG